MKNIVLKFLTSFFLVIILSACGGSSNSSKPSASLSPSNAGDILEETIQTLQAGISGVTGPNIIIDGIVTIKDEFGNILEQTTTDENGAYQIDTLDYEGAINLVLTCQGKSLIKTSEGKQISCKDFIPMYALIPDYSPTDGTKIINITPLTTLAYEASQEIWGDLSADSGNKANQTISQLFPDINFLEEDPFSEIYSEAITKTLTPDFEIPRIDEMIPFLVDYKKERALNINQADLQDGKNLVREIREQSHILYNLTPKKALITPHFNYAYLKLEVEEHLLPIYEYITKNSINSLFLIEEAVNNNQEEVVDTFIREDEEMNIVLSKSSNKIYFSNNQQQEKWEYKITSNNGNTWDGVIIFNPSEDTNLLKNGTISISGALPLAKKSWAKKYQDNLEVESSAIFSTQNGKTDLKIKGFTKVESKYLQISDMIFIDNSSFDIVLENNREKPIVHLSPNFIDIRATNNKYGLDGRLLFKPNREAITFRGTLVSNLTDSVYEGIIEILNKDNFKSVETKGNLELINISRKYKISSIGKEDSNNFNTLDLDYSYLNKDVHISLTKSIEEDQTTWEINIKDETETYLHAQLKGEELSGKITKNGKTLGVIFSFYGLPVVIYADKDISLLF